jgi:hypothetical protein
MPDPDAKLTPAIPADIAESVAFALLFSGKKRVHDSDRMTASIAAQRIVGHLELRFRPHEAAPYRRIGARKSASGLAAYGAREPEIADARKWRQKPS